MFEQVNVPVLGVVENMSYFIAPDTGTKYEIFGKGGGQNFADEYGLNFLGQVPLGMEVREGGDRARQSWSASPTRLSLRLSELRRRSPLNCDRGYEAGACGFEQGGK